MTASHGVYRITNMVTGKSYIGQTRGKGGFQHRWYIHKRALIAGRHHSPKLQRAWTKHGEEAFRIDILHEIPLSENPEEFDRLEVEEILLHDSIRNGYNILPGGTTHPMPEGREPLSPEATLAFKEKLSSALRKRWDTPGYREKMSAHKKRLWTDDSYREKMCRVSKASWSDATQKVERRKNMSKALTAKWADPEYRKKQSEASSRSEVSRKRSETKIRTWNDPEIRKVRVAALQEASRKRALIGRKPEEVGMTQDEVRRHRDKLRQRERRANMTPEQREERNAKAREYHHRKRTSGKAKEESSGEA